MRGFRDICKMHFYCGGFHPGRLGAILLALIVAFAAAPLQAAGLDEALAHFTTDDFSETADGIYSAYVNRLEKMRRFSAYVEANS